MCRLRLDWQGLGLAVHAKENLLMAGFTGAGSRFVEIFHGFRHGFRQWIGLPGLTAHLNFAVPCR
jgi:hypothetical protein